MKRCGIKKIPSESVIVTAFSGKLVREWHQFHINQSYWQVLLRF